MECEDTFFHLYNTKTKTVLLKYLNKKIKPNTNLKIIC